MKAMKRGARTAAVMSLATVLGLAIGAATLAADKPTVSKNSLKQREKTYIVQMKGSPLVQYDGRIAGLAATKPAKGERVNVKSPQAKRYAAHLAALHDAALAAVGGGNKFYDYNVVFDGFAARMTPEQAEALEARPDVARVFEDRLMKPQTNSTPAFLGISTKGGPWDQGFVGENIVIGAIDTGIQPDHPSLRDVPTPKKGDKGAKIPYGPPPASWTGTGCDFGNTAFNPNDAPFTCNNKLLKAQHFNAGFGTDFADGEFLSARDSDGHGTHTATTEGGNNGVPAQIDGEDVGKVSGMAPRARLAVYKVCWDAPNPDDSGCASSDSMAAINQAVADGVDVINFSIGGAGTSFLGPDDLAFLLAADAGVFVAVSAGNDGPGAQTIGTPSGVPWVTATAAIEDNENFGTGLQVNAPATIAGTYEGLEGAGPVTLEDSGTIAAQVVPGVPLNGCTALTNGAAVSGKIALIIRGVCNFDVKYNMAAAAGARAIVVFNDGADPTRVDPITMSAPGTTIPGIMISSTDGATVNTTAATQTVTGTLSPEIKVPRVNRVTGFSSRGPNGGAPDIIKPDVGAPGVHIIAGETLLPNVNNGGGQFFQFLSGTSMASPHTAGTFALLKQAHPDWSPGIAKSALMTTARQDLRKTFGPNAADPFDMGAGMIRPTDALEPGLAYDVGFLDYLAFLCGSETQNGVSVVGPLLCSQLQGAGFSLDSSDLNLASIGVASLVGRQTVHRTITNVSKRPHRYNAVVTAPPGIDVEVRPSGLILRSGESADFTVTFTVNASAVVNQWTFGALTWRGSGHDVRSPIAVRPQKLSVPAQVRASGSPGTLGLPVQFGYTGPYSVTVNGLIAGAKASASVADGGVNQHNFVVPAGTTLARFAMYDEDVGPGSDIDLQVFRFNPGGGATLVGTSGGGTSEEVVNLVNPVAATYAVLVVDFATPAGPTAYSLFNYNMNGTDAGNLHVTTPPAVIGTSGTDTLNWDALGAGTRHLAILSHKDATSTLATTEVLINTQ